MFFLLGFVRGAQGDHNRDDVVMLLLPVFHTQIHSALT